MLTLLLQLLKRQGLLSQTSLWGILVDIQSRPWRVPWANQMLSRIEGMLLSPCHSASEPDAEEGQDES